MKLRQKNSAGESVLSKKGSSAEFVQVIRFRKMPKVMQQSEFRNA
jgi:hypothetical protein